jgi:7-cyano-7-deazaguanine synthase
LHLAKEQGQSVSAIFVDYGQEAAVNERAAAIKLCGHLTVPLREVVCRASASFGSGEIFGRNGFLVMAALMYGSKIRGKIGLGIHAGTPYYDCTTAFAESMNRVLTEYSDGAVELWTPFLCEPKITMYRYLKTTGIPLEITYSCEAGKNPPCQTCLSCLDRKALACI